MICEQISLAINNTIRIDFDYCCDLHLRFEQLSASPPVFPQQRLQVRTDSNALRQGMGSRKCVIRLALLLQ
jgi:hypothetical protein